MYFTTIDKTLVGRLILLSDGTGLTGLLMEGQKGFEKTGPQELVQRDNLEAFIQTRQWLERYFKGECPSILGLPLKPEGSDFRQRVWRLLMEIPYGELQTYGALAQIIGTQMGRQKMSAQAIGGAVGHNPISIIIPCHRVVGVGGNLTGYAGGLQKKIRLLEHEGVDMSRVFNPEKNS